VNQGGGKRKGSFAVYLEPWHADIMEFLDLRLNQGDEEARCHDLFTALWIPDLFMKAVENDEDWHLMCPNQSPGLQDTWGKGFDELYKDYVRLGRFVRVVKARDIWNAMLKSQVETGTPYMCYKDSANSKSNQMNIGTIKSSNLCVAPETEVLTLNGYVQIKDIVDRAVKVWNGFEFSMVKIQKTSESSKLIKITMDNGTFLECTEYHKFHLNTGIKEAKDLLPGDTLIEWSRPSVFDIGSQKGLYSEGNVSDVSEGYRGYPRNWKGPGPELTPSTKFVRVVSIEDNNRFDETYCFNEPKRHMGIFNGMITGNCTEIMEVSEPDETAVCNLASLSLPAFVDNGEFRYDKLHEVTQVVTRNLNKVIDKNYYPTEAARKSNMRHRPIAIGVQGLADVFMMLGIPFDSDQARGINELVFETMYCAAIYESSRLTEKDGPYETFKGSPASKGILNFDFWKKNVHGSDALRASVMTKGLRNSLLIAPMPTATTAQILGNNEAFEPYTTNIYLRRTLAGEFVMVNKHLVKDLQAIGKWNSDVKNEIIRTGGSVQSLDIPENLKAIYRTVWEIPQKSIIDMSADRGPFVDQSQSLNIFMEDPSLAKLSSMHFYGWKKGLKTGMYYLRTRPKAKPQQVTVPVRACSLANPNCEMCSG